MLVYDRSVPIRILADLKTELVGGGRRVRLERRVKNLSPVLDRAAADRYGWFAFVTEDTQSVTDLDYRALE